MKLGLGILLGICFSCLVSPTWGTGILAAKKAAIVGAAKGAALSALVTKGALLKGLMSKKFSGGKPTIVMQKLSQTKSDQKDHKPFLEVDSNLHPTVLGWNSDVMVPEFTWPFEPKLLEFDSPSILEELTTVEVKKSKPCPTLKHPKKKVFWDLINKAMKFKTNAVTAFIEAIEPQEQPVVYTIVRDSNTHPVPVEHNVAIGKRI